MYELELFSIKQDVSPLLVHEGIQLIGFVDNEMDLHDFKTPYDAVKYIQKISGHSCRVWRVNRGHQVFSTGRSNPFPDYPNDTFYGFLIFERRFFQSYYKWKQLSPQRREVLDKFGQELMREYTIWVNGGEGWGYLIRKGEDVIEFGFFDTEAEAEAEGKDALKNYTTKESGK